MALLSRYPDWLTTQRVTSPFVKADRGGFLAFEARQRPQILLSPPFGRLRTGAFPKGETEHRNHLPTEYRQFQQTANAWLRFVAVLPYTSLLLKPAWLVPGSQHRST